MSNKKRTDIVNIIDVESTCWDDKHPKPDGVESEIIEVGIVQLSAKDLSLGRSGSILVTPAVSTVSPFCTQLTTITQEMVHPDNGAVRFREMIHILMRDYHTHNATWASWGDYDRIQFERNREMYNGPGAWHEGFEHMPDPFGSRHINIKTLFALARGIEECNLTEALAHLGLTFEGTLHRGKDDALNIAKVLRFILYKARMGG